GLSNFRDVSLDLRPDVGVMPGAYPFRVTVASMTQAGIQDTSDGTLDVLANGVDVTLNPPSGPPGSSFQLTVTNTGQVTDTFDLSLAGPAALVASLGTSKVTLAPGVSQVVLVTTGAVNFAVSGTLNLTGAARSEGAPTVVDSASANLTIAQTTGLTAE